MCKKLLAIAFLVASRGIACGALTMFCGDNSLDWEYRSLVLAKVVSVGLGGDQEALALDIRATITGPIDPAKTPRITARFVLGPYGSALKDTPPPGALVVVLLSESRAMERGRPGKGTGKWSVETSTVEFMPHGQGICIIDGIEDEVVELVTCRVRGFCKVNAVNDGFFLRGRSDHPQHAAHETQAAPSLAAGLSAIGAHDVAPPAVPAKGTGIKTVTLRQPELGVGFEMVLVRPGSFEMGDNLGNPDEKPAHKVAITRPFYLGKFLVTRQLWMAVLPGNPRMPRPNERPNEPVNGVSWRECQEFIERANSARACAAAQGGVANPGGHFRLPTEAEWEYACRAGSMTNFSFGDSEEKLGEYAWFGHGGWVLAQPVGQKKPNPWGLYDMHGGIWEWCSDRYSPDYYASSPQADPIGPVAPTFGHARVLRGGSFVCGPKALYSAFRYWRPEGDQDSRVGFRLAMTAPDEPSLPPGEPVVSPVKVDGSSAEKAEARDVKK